MAKTAKKNSVIFFLFIFYRVVGILTCDDNTIVFADFSLATTVPPGAWQVVQFIL